MTLYESAYSLIDLKSSNIDIEGRNLGRLRRVFDYNIWGLTWEDIQGSSMNLSMRDYERPYELFGDNIIRYSGNPDFYVSILQNDKGKIVLWRRFQRDHFKREETTVSRIHRGPIDKISVADGEEANCLFRELGIDMYSVWDTREEAVRVFFWKTGFDKDVLGINLVKEAYHEDLFHPSGDGNRYIWEGVTVEHELNPVLSKLGDFTGFDIDKLSIAFYNPDKLSGEVRHYENILGEIAITLK